MKTLSKLFLGTLKHEVGPIDWVNSFNEDVNAIVDDYTYRFENKFGEKAYVRIDDIKREDLVFMLFMINVGFMHVTDGKYFGKRFSNEHSLTYWLCNEVFYNYEVYYDMIFNPLNVYCINANELLSCLPHSFTFCAISHE